jgi:hypothetical protein
MKESEWFDLLQNPQGRLARVLPKLFKHFSQFGSAGVWYPKGQIVLMVSLDGWEEQLASVQADSKRLDEFYTATFVTGSGTGGSRLCAPFIVMLDGRLVKIGLTIHDIEFIEFMGTAEEQ